MIRYGVIEEKNPREILLLRGSGCRWGRCTFCDYHLDRCADEEQNLLLARREVEKVTGIYGHLEVINSGSFVELGQSILEELIRLCEKKRIHTLHFECHYLYRKEIPAWREAFARVGTQLKIKTGVESFDYAYRENVLKKGIPEKDPAVIAEYFDECCLLFGLSGQTAQGMIRDVETGLRHFERVCINIFEPNTTGMLPDEGVIAEFKEQVMPRYAGKTRVDILLHNTDFGVGEGAQAR